MMDQSNAARPARAWALLTHTVSARHGGIFVSAALAAVGLLFVWLAARIELGDAALPGPGLFPLALGLIVVALAAVTGVRLWAEAADNEPIELGHRDVLIVFAALLAVPPLFEVLGAWITLGLFGTLLLMLVARCSLWLASFSAVIAMAMCWYFFQVALGLQLPAGPF